MLAAKYHARARMYSDQLSFLWVIRAGFSLIFPSSPTQGHTSENLSGSLSLFGESKKSQKEALLVHACESVCVCARAHILNKVISLTDTVCLGSPDFRVRWGSWDLRKSRLVTWESRGTPSPHVALSSPCWLWVVRFIHVFIRVCIFLMAGTRPN